MTESLLSASEGRGGALASTNDSLIYGNTSRDQ